MKKHLHRVIGLCAAVVMLLAAAGCSQQAAPESSSTPPVVETDATDPNVLTVVRSMELAYANNFAVDYCANGCKIITDGAGQKFLWVPEGGSVPQDVEGMTVLQAPLTKIGCFSTTHATLFRAIGALDKVSLVTTDKDKWYIDQIAQQIEDGTTTYVGKNSAPDYELISAAAPQVILISANTMHGSDEVLAKLDELGIPYIADSQHLENHPLGRVEWVKLVGALLDMEEEADAYFNEEVERVQTVADQVAQETEHPSVIQTYVFKGTVYVRNGGDYVNKMLELAGGDYPFADLEPDQGGNTKMKVEEFYQGAVDADVLIYDNTSDVSVSTVADILANGDYLADMKAIREGNVWGIQKNYWQSADDVATMIEDIATILYHPENADQLHYFYKLPTE